ncbi:hypothetical protein [Nocardia farcinica]|uniref:hypothetical protein n=1 Tax=Nocardia farcinica TaxID=37329 RepID=UPI002454097F|nr:hypothetical protein [Nocardia farcinica]
MKLDFQRPAEQAQKVADELMSGGYRSMELTVVIDDDVRDGLPPLPCGELWE